MINSGHNPVTTKEELWQAIEEKRELISINGDLAMEMTSGAKLKKFGFVDLNVRIDKLEVALFKNYLEIEHTIEPPASTFKRK